MLFTEPHGSAILTALQNSNPDAEACPTAKRAPPGLGPTAQRHEEPAPESSRTFTALSLPRSYILANSGHRKITPKNKQKNSQILSILLRLQLSLVFDRLLLPWPQRGNGGRQGEAQAEDCGSGELHGAQRPVGGGTGATADGER